MTSRDACRRLLCSNNGPTPDGVSAVATVGLPCRSRCSALSTLAVALVFAVGPVWPTHAAEVPAPQPRAFPNPTAADLGGPVVHGPFAATSFGGDLRTLAAQSSAGYPSSSVREHVPGELAPVSRPAASTGIELVPGAGQSTHAPTQADQAAATGPMVLRSFAGLPNLGASPPDPVIAASAQHVVQMTNHPSGSVFAIYDRLGATVVAATPLSDLWASGFCRTAGRGDPIVLFDHLAGRWLMTQLYVPGSFTAGGLCIAVAKTADPLAGGWWLYEIVTGAFPDYPKYAIWPDAYTMGANQLSGSGASFTQTAGALAFDRTAMLAGQPARVIAFAELPLPGFAFQGLLPATLLGAAPPAGSPAIFLRHRDDELHDASPTGANDWLELWEMRVSWSEPTSSSLSGPIKIALPEFSSTVAQTQGNNTPLLVRPEPLMWPVTYRDGAVPKITSAFSIAANPGRPTTRWFSLQRLAGTWSVEQQGNTGPATDAVHRWMATAITDHQGNLALVYNTMASNPTVFPSLRSSGRLAGDPTGVLSSEVDLAAGLAWQNNGTWGDYNGLAVEPSGQCELWFTGAIVGADEKWQTRVGALRFADCIDRGTSAGCSAAEDRLCLASQRFEVSVDWRTQAGETGFGRAVPLSGDTGYFWFFAAANVELILKVLDGCGLNNHFWVFAGGLTDVAVTITVRDTVTGLERTYQRPAGVAFSPLQDTEAFATCNQT